MPLDTRSSWKRCPKTSCPSYGKRLVLEVGQDGLGEGDQGLTVEHTCPDCRYVERGPRNPTGARRTSRTAIDRLARWRLDGWVVPLKPDTEPWPEEALREQP